MAHVPPLSMAPRADVCAAPDTVPHPLQSYDATTRGAFLEGHEEGERIGYLAGWRWGAFCGSFFGFAACGLLALLLGFIAGSR